MNFFNTLKQVQHELVEELSRRGVARRYLNFGGPGEEIKKVTVPTDARSEFLANRAMGDWAEDILAASIEHSCEDLTVSHYGDSDRMAAGEEGFRDFYLSRTEDVRISGKRPDLLIFSKSQNVEKDLTGRDTEDLVCLVKQARMAIEVRSRKFEAITYMKTRETDKSNGKRTGRDTPSFTVKVEDLIIVYRWLEKYNVPQIYTQVFFDSIFSINFLSIFQIIASGEGYSIENPAKSQEKSTIMIPITCGAQIAVFEKQPDFEVRHKITRLGRHDAYVQPVGGKVKIDYQAFRNVINC